jgi:hypothetical protein
MTKTKPKKQYIYVARLTNNELVDHYVSDKKIDMYNGCPAPYLKKTPKFHTSSFEEPFGLKLKKGEQVRIPIDIERAENVK